MNASPQGVFCRRQRGVTLISAIFLITTIALLGAAMTRLMVLGTATTLNEMLSAQAFYAAESGIDWAAYQISTGIYSEDCPYQSGEQPINTETHFSVVVSGCETPVGGRRLYQINSTGSRSGYSGSIQRQLQVSFLPPP